MRKIFIALAVMTFLVWVAPVFAYKTGVEPVKPRADKGKDVVEKSLNKGMVDSTIPALFTVPEKKMKPINIDHTPVIDQKIGVFVASSRAESTPGDQSKKEEDDHGKILMASMSAIPEPIYADTIYPAGGG